MIVMKQHPLSAEFKRMPDDAFAELVSDIKEQGQLEFITEHEGKILDGWNRYLACQQLGIEPKIQKFSKKDPIAFVKGKNLHRRHEYMDAPERALQIVRLNAHYPSGRNLPPTNEKMAKEANVSIQTIKEVKVLETSGSEALKKAVEDKEVPLATAAKVARTVPKSKQVKAAKTPKPKAEPKERKPKPEKAPKVEEEDNTLKELQAANKEILALQAQSESLQKDDKDAEIVKLHKRITGLEGRLEQSMTTQKAAESDAKYAKGLLQKIRKALKVEKDGDILQAIRE